MSIGCIVRAYQLFALPMHLPDSFIHAQTSIPLLGAAMVGVSHAFRMVRRAVTEKVAVLKTKFAGEGGEGSSTAVMERVTTEGRRDIARMAAVGSLIFALQMVNFSIDGGTSGHLLGGVLAALIVGPMPALLVMAVILLVQATVFADGGLLALGANIINMGCIGAVGGYYLYRLFRGLGEKVSITLAAWVSVILAAIAASFELAVSGTATLGVVLPAMLGYHAIIGIGEAIITLGVISLLSKYQYPMFFNEQAGSK